MVRLCALVLTAGLPAAMLAATILGGGFCGAAQAQIQPEFSAEVGLLSKYLWRGSVLSEGPVMQPTITAGLGGLELGVWSNVDLDNVNERSGQIGEIDYSAGYTLGLGVTELTAGVLNYTYPKHHLSSTTEIYAGASFPWLAAPSLTLYRDVDTGKCTYLSLGLGHSLPVGSQALDATLAVGWGDEAHNEFNYGVAVGGLTDASVTLSVDLALAPFAGLRPMVGYMRLLGEDLRTAADHPDNVLFGITLTGGL